MLNSDACAQYFRLLPMQILTQFQWLAIKTFLLCCRSVRLTECIVCDPVWVSKWSSECVWACMSACMLVCWWFMALSSNWLEDPFERDPYFQNILRATFLQKLSSCFIQHCQKTTTQGREAPSGTGTTTARRNTCAWGAHRPERGEGKPMAAKLLKAYTACAL